MIHILLLLLKIIGITLLSVLGLLILIVLAVLFVPIRYSLDLKAEERAGNDVSPQDGAEEDGQTGTALKVRARVSWLLHLLHARAVYDGAFGVVIRLFGIPVRRMPSPEDHSSAPKEKRKKKKRPKNGHLVPGQKAADDDDREGGAETTADGGMGGSDYGSPEAVKNDGAGEPAAGGIPANAGGTDAAHMSADGNQAENAAAQADSGAAQNDGAEPSETENEDTPEDGKTEKLSFFQKIARFFRRLADFFRAVRVFFSKILYTIRNICGKIEHVKEQIGYYCGVLKSEEGQKSIALVKRELGRLLRHIAPTKLTGSLTLGMEDPAATGQIVAILSMFYPIYGNNVSITPDFDEQCIRGSLYLKGRIRIFTLIRIAWRVYFNKDMKKFLHMLKREENEA
ncbi:MAG: DUF2953 domain-containing protein [Clostridium sp.]|nr:DUF2953 domain-containing protein [Clostridium sp.]